MSGVSVKLFTKDFEKRLIDYSVSVHQGLKKEIVLTSQEVITDAKLLSPVSPGGGRLRSSIHVLTRRPDGLGTEVGSNVEYADKMEGKPNEASGFNHAQGRHKGKPTKFLEPAVDKNREGFMRRVKKIMK